MPTAGRQSPEHRIARGLIIEMEGLRMELACKAPDLFFIDPQPP